TIILIVPVEFVDLTAPPGMVMGIHRAGPRRAFLVDGIASEVAFAAAVIARHRTILRAFARGPAHREPAGVAARSAIAAAPAEQATFAAEIAAIAVAIMLAARPAAVALMIAAELPAAAQAALVHPAVALPAPLGV